MMSLTNLKELGIYSSSLECLPPLGKLPFLKSLTMWGIERLKKLGAEFMGIEESENRGIGKFHVVENTTQPQRDEVGIWCFNYWEEWNGIGGEEEEEEDCIKRFTRMPRLQDLEILVCTKFKSVPNFLCTTPLQKLKISTCPILEECFNRGIGEDWPKISHIPNIIID
ncbi:hypothetical protein ACB092_03G023000, partial [Castanea dentata]